MQNGKSRRRSRKASSQFFFPFCFCWNKNLWRRKYMPTQTTTSWLSYLKPSSFSHSFFSPFHSLSFSFICLEQQNDNFATHFTWWIWPIPIWSRLSFSNGMVKGITMVHTFKDEWRSFATLSSPISFNNHRAVACRHCQEKWTRLEMLSSRCTNGF